MGIVNLSADSFSGDGSPEIEAALAKARQHLTEGADIIDIGAESARTNRGPIEEREETELLRSFIERWPELSAEITGEGLQPLLSINTWRAGVVRE
ncbi:MAG: dihydropteroate synthase, partial [Verrucomicrobiaceae bacterium]